MLHTQLAVAVAEQEVLHLKKQILQVAMAVQEHLHLTQVQQ
jgi:hypothetical protein